MTESLLRRSVITSSSGRQLVDLLTEVRAIAGEDVEFDLIALREPDVSAIESEYGPLEPGATERAGDPLFPRTFTEIMARSGNLRKITSWTLKQLARGRAHVAALATYFPNVSSAYKYRRECAIDALVNAVKLAFSLVEWGMLDVAVVELVCGTILDPCECSECKPKGRTFVSKKAAKFDVLLTSLETVVSNVRELQDAGKLPRKPFALGVELEPGDIYLLNDSAAISCFFEKLDALCERDEQRERPLGLRSHIGFNLDIAHMRIADVTRKDLAPHRNRIVHAHITDHPMMHTRDQIIGSWTSIDRLNNEFGSYLQLLYERLDAYERGQGVPFSGSFALELEGCNRIGWIFDSLRAMKQLSMMARLRSQGVAV